MMSVPLVSIILTSYNQPGLLERAFNSLIHQTYKNIEIIFVDDCSGDPGNKKFIEECITEHPSITTAFYQERNVGIPANKNRGFKLAKGEYITYLDGDDTYYENKIASEIETFLKHPEVDVVYSNFDIKSFDDKLLSIWSKDIRPQGNIFKDIILNKFPDCHTHRYELFKRRVLYNLNFYDDQFSVYHDLDFMLRYSLKYKVAYNDNICSSYYKNPESIVSKTRSLALIEQQEKVYAKYKEEIKKNHLEKAFNKYLQSLQINKLFYLERLDYGKLFSSFLSAPFQLFKLLRIANYLHKTRGGTS